MKDFYIVGRINNTFGNQELYTYSYNGNTVINYRESAELIAEQCNERYPCDTEWKIFKIVEVE